MNILLIWEEIPEKTTIYLFKNVNEADEIDLLGCHGTHIGTGNENIHTNAVNLMLSNPNNTDSYERLYSSEEHDTIKDLDCKIDKIVVSGFFL